MRYRRTPGASPSGTTLTAQRLATAGTDAFSVGVTGDAADRFVLNADGKQEWGAGTGATDLFLYRVSAGRAALGASDNYLEVGNLGFGADTPGIKHPSASIAALYVQSGNTFVDGGSLHLRANGSTRVSLSPSQTTFSASAKFDATTTWGDAVNIVLGTTTGTKIGTATTQKLGFFNATPVVQPASPGADATDLASVITLANNLKARLVALGLTG